MISFLLISLSLNFVGLVKFILPVSFIFEMTQNYIVFSFKVIRRKQTSKISQFFTSKHKINESNAEVPTHYQIVSMFPKNISFYVFVPDKILNFFRNMFNTKTIDINNFTSSTK